MGTPAAEAWLMASTVCGITLSSAATMIDGNIGHLGTAGTHGGEGFVTRVSRKVMRRPSSSFTL